MEKKEERKEYGKKRYGEKREKKEVNIVNWLNNVMNETHEGWTFDPF